jgi:hypothetical protein
MVVHRRCGQAGYRDGISAGKEAALQEGFDAGFADTGAPRGRELGILRGLAAALLHLSPRPADEPGQTQTQARIREIVGKLAAVGFADLVPPNEEATALHEAGPDALCATNGSGSSNDVKGQSLSTDDLRALRTQLETLLLEAGLNIALDLD